ncbi:MAG: hypothetical protein PWQ41_1862 [Bacillota bacterium]|nr:hypothetical protein [Bacillota bacterium]MDK2856796.1 hypothetical protein [Bacillota bacterium]MDK2926088.1 hypothetical protein [Bacillota bacterium]
MGEKIEELSRELQAKLAEAGVNPAELLVQAGVTVSNKDKLYELAQDAGLISDEAPSPQALMAMAQNLTAALDPATKKSLGTLITQVVEQSGAGTPPPEIQSFVQRLLGSDESPKK